MVRTTTLALAIAAIGSWHVQGRELSSDSSSSLVPVTASVPVGSALSPVAAPQPVEPWQLFDVDLDRLFGPYEQWHRFTLAVAPQGVSLPNAWFGAVEEIRGALLSPAVMPRIAVAPRVGEPTSIAVAPHAFHGNELAGFAAALCVAAVVLAAAVVAYRRLLAWSLRPTAPRVFRLVMQGCERLLEICEREVRKTAAGFALVGRLVVRRAAAAAALVFGLLVREYRRLRALFSQARMTEVVEAYRESSAAASALCRFWWTGSWRRRLELTRSVARASSSVVARSSALVARPVIAPVAALYAMSWRNRGRTAARAMHLCATAAAVAAVVFAGTPGSALGATYYWDSDGTAGGNATTGTGLGSGGPWDTTSNLWWDGVSSDVAWTNAGPDTAVFLNGTATIGVAAGGVTTGAMTIGNATSIGNYTFDSNSITLNGTGVVDVNFLSTATINSQLSGGVGLTKTGGGVLTLTNASNNYTGTTTVSRGTLVINSNGALGTDSSTVVVSGSQVFNTNDSGQLVLAGGYSTGFTLSRNLSVSGYGPSGSGNSGNTAALLSIGYNTISGAVTTASANNTTLQHAFGKTTYSGTVNISGTLGSTLSTFSANSGSFAVMEITGTLAGTGTLQKAGTGTLILNPSDATGFSGQIRATGGTVRLSSNASLGTDPGTATLYFAGGGFEFRSDAPDFNKKLTSANTSGTNTIFVDHAVGGTAINQTVTIPALTLSADAISVTGRNGYNTTISAITGGNLTGNVRFENTSNGLLTIATSTTNWTTNSTDRILTFNGSGNITLTGSVAATGGAHSLNIGRVPGSGVTASTNTVTIMGTGSTYTGVTTVNSGTLVITDFRSINDNTAQIVLGSSGTGAGAGTLTIGTSTTGSSGGLNTSKPIDLGGTTLGATINASQPGANPVILNGAFTASGAGTKTLTLGGTNTLDNVINTAIVDNLTGTNLTNLTKADAGTWVLAGVNTYTGTTTITGGTLKLTANAAASTIITDASAIIFNSNATTLAAGGTLQFTGVSGSATTETLGALTPTAGAGTVKIVSGGGGAAANLVFSSLGTVAKGSGVNFDTALSGGGTVTITGVATSTAATLPGNGHFYINGADFARSSSGVMVAPVYGTDAGFVTSASALTASSHNQITGSFSNGAVSITSLKISGSQTLTMTGNLTVNTGGTANDGGILQTGGSGAISGSGLITTGGSGQIVIRVDGASDVLTLNTNIGSTTTGGFVKNGAGTLVINAVNAQTGTNSINEGTVRLSGTGRLSASSSAFILRQGATLDLNGLSTGVAISSINGAGTITNTNAAAGTLQIGNTTNGAGIFSGIIQDGTGVVNVTKVGTTGSPTLSGLNTYTGVTTVNDTTGLIQVNTLANIGSASGIGRGDSTSTATNAASLVFTGTTTTGGLAYIGTTTVSTDRLFTMSTTTAGNGGQIANNSANNSALVFSNTNAIVISGAVAQTLTLGGSSTGDNRFNPQITDNGANKTSISKIGAGLWILGNASNSYTGTTSIGSGTTAGGVLQAVDGSTLPTASGLILGGTTGGGVFQSSGNFVRSLVSGTPGSGQVTWNSGLTTGAAGFAASDAKLVVALGGLASPTALTWNSGGFVNTGAILLLNSPTALNEVEFRNAIDFGGSLRTVQVNDNTSTQTDYATLSGVLSGAGGGLSKSGTGVLQVVGANTYTGQTAVTAGTLIVTSLGNTASPGATSVGDSTSANLLASAVTLGNGGTGAGILIYAGSGETSNRYISINTTTGGTQLVADGSGGLTLTNVNNDVAGEKTLFLRGTGALVSRLTSNMADNGGALAITHDTGNVWVLSGSNTGMSGTVSATAGMLGAANDDAFGTGGLTIGNGVIFSEGGDRTLANNVTHNNNTSAGFSGDYSINLTGTSYTNASTTGSNIITNNIIAGKTLTIGGALTSNSITAARNLTFNGSGATIVNGAITTNTAFALSLIYSGTGSLTLGNTGNDLLGTAVTAGTVTVSSGTLRLGTSNIFSTAGTKISTLILGPAAATTATFDLNGNSDVISSGLTATSAGNVVIDNSSASAATLTLDTATNAVTIAPSGAGTFAVNNTGAGALSITKAGAGTISIAAGNTLAHTGATTVTGGTLSIAGTVSATTALSATGGGSLSLTGTLSSPGSITSVTVGGGSFLSLLNGVGTSLSSLSTLNLGTGGSATLSVEIGTGTDTLTTSAAATTANTITFNLSGITGIADGTTYNLLVAPSGLSGGTYALGSQPGGFTGGTLNVSDTLVSYTTGTAIVGDLYYNNQGGTASWAHNVSNVTNFTTDLAGTTDGTFTPGPGSTVYFGTTALTGGPAFTTTLDANFTVAGLKFTSNPSGVTSWTVNAGTPSTSVLSLKTAGIEVQSNAGAVTINSDVTLVDNQSWSVDGTGVNGSSLAVNGVVTGGGILTKTGAGTLTMSGANLFSGGLIVSEGTVVGTTSNKAFGDNGTGTVTLGNGGTNNAVLQFGTTGLTYANPIVLSGTTGTLTIGTPVDAVNPISGTFSAGVTGTGNLTINNQSLSGTTAFSTTAVNNVGTVTNVSTSTGTATISGGVGSNVTQVILNSTTSALTVSTGGLTVNSGGTTLVNTSGVKVLTVSGAVGGTGNLVLQYNSGTGLSNGIVVSGAPNNVGTITNNGTGADAAASAPSVQISGAIGTNVTGVIQNSATTSLLLSGASTSYTGGITILKGTLEANNNVNALGAAGNVITLGNTSGSDNASLRFHNALTYVATPINVVAGSSGTLSILGSRTTGDSTISGAITLAHDLVIGAGDAGATTADMILSGGVTGTGNLAITYSATALTGTVTFSTNPLNMTGSITNNGNTTGATTISSVIGTNVTGVTQNSSTSRLNLTGANTYTTTTTLTLGTLTAGAAEGVGSGPLGNGGTIDFAGGTLQYSAANQFDYSSRFSNAASRQYRADTNGQTVIWGSDLTSSGGTLTKSGTGTLTVSGTNTYDGLTTVSAGALRVTNNSSLGTTAAGTTVSSGAALELDGSGGDLAITAEGLTLAGTGISAGGALRNIAGSNSLGVAASTIITLVATSRINSDSGTLTIAGNIVRDISNRSLTLGGVGNIVINGVIGNLGTGNVTKDGSGTVSLLGANTYVRGTVVNAGVLVINTIQNATSTTANSLGIGATVANTTITIGNGGTLRYAGSASGSSDRTVILSTLTGGTFTLDASGSTPFLLSGLITNSGTSGTSTLTLTGTGTGAHSGLLADGTGNTAALTKSGTGTWTIGNAANTFSGKTTVEQGALAFNAGNASATAAQSLGQNTDLDLGVAVTSSGTLIYGGAGAGTLAKNINVLGDGNDTIQNGGGGLLTLSGTITKNGTILTLKGGSSGIDVTGVIAGSSSGSDLLVDGGTVTLSNANTYNGPTFIRNGGTLNAAAAGAMPTSTRSAVTLDDSGSGSSTLALVGFDQSIASLTGASSSMVNLNAQMLTVGTTSGSTTFAGVISGVGGTLTKDGASTLVLSGANTYSGATTVSGGGVLAIADDSGLGTAPGAATPGHLTLSSGILATTASMTLDQNRGLALAGVGGQLNTAASTTLTYSGIAAGVGGLEKAGTGTLVLAGVNTYGGGTLVSAGTLVATNDDALGTNDVQVTTGGTLALQGGITTPGTQDLLLDNPTSGDVILSNVSGNNTWGGDISANPGTGSGRVRILSNTVGDTLTISGGITLADGSSSDFVIGGDGDGVINGTITSGTSTSRLFKSSSGAGTWTLAADNSTTFTGKTTIGNGTIKIASENNLGTTPGAFVSNQLSVGGASNGTLQTTATMSISANRGITLGAAGGTFNTDASTTLTINSVVAGTSLTKTGSGTLNLTAANTYSGATNVNAGTLLVNGTNSGSGAVTVASGATLGGNGSIAGAVTVQSGGILAPGNSPDTQTYAGGLALNSGSFYNWEHTAGNALGTAGTDYDQILVTGGTLTVTSGAKLNMYFDSATSFSNAFWDSNQSWTIIDASTAGGYSGSFASGDLAIYVNNVLTGSGNTIAGQGSFTTSLSGGGLLSLDWTAAAGSGNYWAPGASGGHDGSTTWTSGASVWATTSGVQGTLTQGSGPLVFTDTAGTVTVSGGVSTGNGLTFSSNGYTLSGSTITLSGGSQAANTITTDSGVTATIGSTLSGTNGLSKAGTGTLYLTDTGNGGSISGGTALNAGVLKIDDAGALAGGTISFNGGTLQVTQTNSISNALDVNSASGGIQVDSGTATFGGAITGAFTLGVSGSGTAVFTGNNTSTAVIDVGNGSTAQVTAGAGQSISSQDVTLGTGSALNFNQTGTGTYSGDISGPGSVDVSGGGTLTFSGTNSYSGGTTVGGATLVVDGTMNTSSGVLAVNSGGVLMGTGTTGEVEVNNGGTWSPGHSVDSQSTGNADVTLNGGSSLVFEFKNATGSTPGTDWDLIDLGTGTIHINANNFNPADQITVYIDSWKLDGSGHGGGVGPDWNNFDASAAPPITDYYWLFMSVTDNSKIVIDDPLPGSLSGRFQVIDYAANAGVFTTDPQGNPVGTGNPYARPSSAWGQGTFKILAGNFGGQGYGLYVHYSAIPEPGSMILCGLASLGCGWYGRRKLRKSAAATAAATDETTGKSSDA